MASSSSLCVTFSCVDGVESPIWSRCHSSTFSTEAKVKDDQFIDEIIHSLKQALWHVQSPEMLVIYLDSTDGLVRRVPQSLRSDSRHPVLSEGLEDADKILHDELLGSIPNFLAIIEPDVTQKVS
jgi:hypothetical protein